MIRTQRKKILLEAVRRFLVSIRSWIILNEAEGTDAILQKYYAKIEEIWSEKKEELKRLLFLTAYIITITEKPDKHSKN